MLVHSPVTTPFRRSELGIQKYMMWRSLPCDVGLAADIIDMGELVVLFHALRKLLDLYEHATVAKHVQA